MSSARSGVDLPRIEPIRLDTRVSATVDLFDAPATDTRSYGDSRSSRDKYEPADWSLPVHLIRRLSPRPSVPHNCLIVFL